MVLRTVSAPSDAFSTTVSPTLSTTYSSSPFPPIMVSAPTPPSSTLLPVLPIKVFAIAFPVALTAVNPVNVNFSMLTNLARL